MTFELGRRILFTLGALLVYRLGTHIPLPGLDSQVWGHFFRSQYKLFGILDLFAGGGISRLAIFALGIAPYISAAILLRLASIVSPSLRRQENGGERGRQKIARLSIALTVFLTVIQGYGIARGLENVPALVAESGWTFRLTTTLTLSGGALFSIWLADQITARGIGNGFAIILSTGIVTTLPFTLIDFWLAMQQGLPLKIVNTLAALAIVLTVVIVLFESARRFVPLQWRPAGGKMVKGTLALKLNNAGLIPTILASWVLLLPATLINYAAVDPLGWAGRLARELSTGRPLFIAAYGLLIVVLVFFYTAFLIDPEKAAADLKARNGIIPGIAAGDESADYLDRALTFTTLAGGIYLAGVFLIPQVLIFSYGSSFGLHAQIGGAAFLIVICTILDIKAQLQNEFGLKLGAHQ